MRFGAGGFGDFGGGAFRGGLGGGEVGDCDGIAGRGEFVGYGAAAGMGRSARWVVFGWCDKMENAVGVKDVYTHMKAEIRGG